jgi:hypothetical protein
VKTNMAAIRDERAHVMLRNLSPTPKSICWKALHVGGNEARGVLFLLVLSPFDLTSFLWVFGCSLPEFGECSWSNSRSVCLHYSPLFVHRGASLHLLR